MLHRRSLKQTDEKRKLVQAVIRHILRGKNFLFAQWSQMSRDFHAESIGYANIFLLIEIAAQRNLRHAKYCETLLNYFKLILTLFPSRLSLK